ncbi:hypothetical protein OSB04_016715 [Centaurea solstitialis]|uniref:TIR domain-containing protein n=1 Tax=Centaurea solstitialis TaxID=347529 RepID=A0AA38TDE0_9ASTR|nr:hypothetical protein OSB04_016715 [Centaurea solstitialis]
MSESHVFLSFSSHDTGKTFTDHLHTALLNAGIQTHGTMENSKIALVVLSKNYVLTTCCLDELAKIIERKEAFGLVVIPIFYDVDPLEMKTHGSLEQVFDQDGLRCDDDKVKQSGDALVQVVDLGGMVLQDRFEPRGEHVGISMIMGLPHRGTLSWVEISKVPLDPGYLRNMHESKFIKEIVLVVERKLNRRSLSVAMYPIGLDSRVKSINRWLQDGSTDVGIMALYALISSIRGASEQPNGLVRLQRQLLSDISQKKIKKIHNIDEGIMKIRDTISCKRVFIVLDDVDHLDQLNAMLGLRKWFHPGSKIIITTRHKSLLKSKPEIEMFEMKGFNGQESLKLFSWHAFGEDNPPDRNYTKLSRNVVYHCGGIPLALVVLGSSLRGRSVDIWESALKKLQAISERDIVGKLRISYDSLPDNHDRSLFLDISCFFVGKEKEYATMILEKCDYFTEVGIQNLVDRCLLDIDEKNKLLVHQLLQDMGREIIRQESPYPGRRSRIWSHKDSYNVLKDKSGGSEIRGLVLDMKMLKEGKEHRRKTGPEEDILEKMLLMDQSYASKRRRLDFFGNASNATSSIQDDFDLETDTFSSMQKLRLLKLSGLRITGCYDGFPKGLRWLYWRGFPLKCIPNEFPLESVVALDMCNSSLTQFRKRSNGVPHVVPSPATVPSPEPRHCPQPPAPPPPSPPASATVASAAPPTTRSVYGSVLNGGGGRKEKDGSYGCMYALKLFDEMPQKDVVGFNGGDGEVVGFNGGGGGESLMMMQVLNFSHCHYLKESPDFSMLPNLKRLILKECIRLAELHESIGGLTRLMLLNLRGCRNLTRLPPHFHRLKSLENLILSGCTKLEKLPVEDLAKLQSLKMLHADEIAISHIASNRNEVVAWRSFFPSWLSKPRTCRVPINFSLASFSSSLLSLSLANCNLTDQAIPSDLTGLCSLKYLNLSGNPIRTLPERIKDLYMLRDLWLDSCSSLESLPELPMSLIDLKTVNCTSLERITNLPNLLESLFLDVSGCEKLSEVEGLFRLEPIRNFGADRIMNELGILNLDVIQNTQVELFNKLTKTRQKDVVQDPVKAAFIDREGKFKCELNFGCEHENESQPHILGYDRFCCNINIYNHIFGNQGLYEFSIFSCYVPGNEIPSWCSSKSTGNSISFVLPSDPENILQGLNICLTYGRSHARKFRHWSNQDWCTYYIKIHNKTKDLKWVYSPTFVGIPDDGEDITLISHWKFGMEMEDGDDVNVSIVGMSKAFQIKGFDIDVLYVQEEKKIIQQNTSGLISAYQLQPHAYFFSNPEYYMVRKSGDGVGEWTRNILYENLFEGSWNVTGSAYEGGEEEDDSGYEYPEDIDAEIQEYDDEDDDWLNAILHAP